MTSQTTTFNYFGDRFADVQILRYRVPGFHELSLEKKQYLYYLYEAALCGRDITWDQHNRHNLTIRATLEAIVKHYQGDRSSQDFADFMTYTKRVWFSNGIHHHYSNQKFQPDFSYNTLVNLAKHSPQGDFPTAQGQTVAQLLEALKPVIFDPEVDAKRVDKDPDADLVQASAVNFYEGLTQEEVRAYHRDNFDNDAPNAPSYGLNSKLVKGPNGIEERTWKVGGMYGQAIEKIVYWLEKAKPLAENETQAEALGHLIDYYRHGDLATFDAYSVAWVRDTQGTIDTINGFIETYSDPLDIRGTYEAIVSVKDLVATKRMETIAGAAQWFEDHSPIDDAHKKEEVKGVSGSVIHVVVEAGDASPATAIGVNLPNADWIREVHGSKSVNLANIVEAYNHAKGKLMEEFCYDETMLERSRKYGDLGDDLHTDLHEVIGHGSGKLEPGVGLPRHTLRNYSSTLEEARADLVALYYLTDPYLLELGIMPSLETGKSVYDNYILNGLMLQLRRLDLGDDLEEDHMRNRQLIAAWALEKGSSEAVIEMKQRDGKHFYVINDYNKLRDLFGQLLREVQRIKSAGDYQACKTLVETYAVRVDRAIHAEVIERFKKLDMAPYCGFINPKLVPVYQNDKIIDVGLEYVEEFSEQMLYYSKHYGLLPHVN